MLSRIAETLYWIGRLVERAEDTARLLEVHVSVLLEDAAASEPQMCDRVVAALGIPDPPPEPTTAWLLERVAYGDDSSIFGALSTARDNARTVREVLSSEVWEALNTTRNALVGQRTRARRLGSPEFFSFVKQRTALVNGLADSTMSRDDPWYFLTLGRHLERVDMTVRLLSLGTASGESQAASVALLRSCGAFEAYLRTYHGTFATHQAAEFLLFDRLFPRSVFSALCEAEGALAYLTPAAAGRTGIDDPGLIALGRARTGLEFADSDDALRHLASRLAGLHQACVDASQAVAERFFDRTAAMTWASE